jgi:hypothetical protein
LAVVDKLPLAGPAAARQAVAVPVVDPLEPGSLALVVAPAAPAQPASSPPTAYS